MQQTGDLILFGLILKTHGIDGQLVLKLFVSVEDELEENEPVFIEIDGIPVPFFIKEFRFLSDDAAIIRLDEVDSSTPASDFVNCRVFIPGQDAAGRNKQDIFGYEELQGFRIVDEMRGDSGILREIVEYSENTLMVIDLDDNEILIPFHENIVRQIDYKNRIIEIAAPDGLLDLYL